MNKNVLVVEDDPAIQKAVAFILEGNHHTVMGASTVEEGLAAAAHADVIVLDLKLGAENGEDFLQKLRRRGSYIPVIVMSGVYAKAPTEARLKKYKIVDFIEKPFKAKDLLDKVGSAERMADSMSSTCEAIDRVKAATECLRILSGKSITEIGQCRLSP